MFYIACAGWLAGWLAGLLACLLGASNGSKASAAEPLKHASRGTAGNSVHRAVAGKLPGLMVASLRDREDVPRPSCRAVAFLPVRTPRDLRDRRS